MNCILWQVFKISTRGGADGKGGEVRKEGEKGRGREKGEVI